MSNGTAFERLQTAAAEVAATADSAGVFSAAHRAEAITTLRGVQDTLAGAEAQLLAEFDENADYAEQGAATTASWMRRALRMTAPDARARVKAGRTLAQLPKVGAAAADGQIRLEHVREFTAGITKVGLATMAEAQDWLLDVARTCDPGELRQVVATLAEVVHPDDLDAAWARGMERHDVNLSQVGDGYHLNGFLDILTGAQFKAWLDARSAPRDAEDARTPAERRVDALAELITAALEHGLPTDKGIRPQLHVTGDLDTFIATAARAREEAAARPHSTETGSTDTGDTAVDDASEARSDAGPSTPDAQAPVRPAELSGFGSVGSDLLSYMTCVADWTAILLGADTTGPTPQAGVLNVGPTWRLATMKQRIAVLARQDGMCANPGCRHTHLEIHHATWWSRGGRTDLDNLVGLCRRCHILVHQDKLYVDADGTGGFAFTRATGTRLIDHRRTTASAVRRRLRALTQTSRQRSRNRAANPSTEYYAVDQPWSRKQSPPMTSIAEAEIAARRRPTPHMRR